MGRPRSRRRPLPSRDSLIALHDIPATLHAHLGVDVGPSTPRQWWKRTRAGEMDYPMPEPEVQIGRTVAWKVGDVVDWYKEWKEAEGEG